MVFSSPIFLFLFLPLFLLGYYCIFAPVKISENTVVKKLFLTASNVFILTSSLLFYFWGETWFVLVMLSTTTIDYFCGLNMGRSSNDKLRKFLLALSISADLSLLAFFKYSNFALHNYNALVGVLGFSSIQAHGFMEVALPLGISFYTFQSMSYTIDVYRKQVQPTRNLVGFAC